MKFVYEFIGTFFLVLTVGMAVINPGGAESFAPLAIGSILAVMIYAGGHVSGGHYNPAVSLAVFIRGKLSACNLGCYWVAQLTAGIVAAYLVLYLKGNPTLSVSSLDTVRAFIAEFLFTFALCFVVLNTATAKGNEGNSFYGFAIGFTVLVGAYTMGAISSAAFNPAVALGTAFMQLAAWSTLWVTILANLLGGTVAALVFKPTQK